MRDLEDTAIDLEASLVESVAGVLDIAVMIYDKNDTLIVRTKNLASYFPVPTEVLELGSRLRDLLGAVYDTGILQVRSPDAKPVLISRDDWVTERIALHWRERHESVEQLKDGRWVRLTKRRLTNGTLIATIGDVTEQKRRDLELADMRDQAELAQHILNNLNNPVLVKDSKLRYVIVNDAFCRILGFHPRNVIGRTASELVDADTAAIFEESEKAVIATGVPFEMPEAIARADGTVMYAITRKRRSGTPGNYYVTVSIDEIPGSIISEQALASAFRVNKGEESDDDPAQAPSWSAPKNHARVPAHVLILDENVTRAAASVSVLRGRGADALAIGNAREAMAFLDAAKSMGVTITSIQASPAMVRDLAKFSSANKHPVLARILANVVEDDADEAAVTGGADGKDGKAAAEAGDGRPAEGQTEPDLVMSHPVVAEKKEETAKAAPAAPAPAIGRDSASKVTSFKPAEAGTEAGSALQPRRIRVLVAEDNQVNQIVFEQILQGLGVDWKIVGNGELAVGEWRQNRPDVILMDVSMPVMNGLQATEAIRAEEHQSGDMRPHTPIVAVTAHAMTGDKEKCFAAGMDDYLSKPVSPEKLEAAIRKWVDGPGLILASA